MPRRMLLLSRESSFLTSVTLLSHVLPCLLNYGTFSSKQGENPHLAGIDISTDFLLCGMKIVMLSSETHSGSQTTYPSGKGLGHFFDVILCS